jgi:hypothetical protein
MRKMLINLILSIFPSQGVQAIQECWTCSAKSVEKCQLTGIYEKCDAGLNKRNKFMHCSTTLRERNGKVVSINMGKCFI